jgi:hypothetical protein
MVKKIKYTLKKRKSIILYGGNSILNIPICIYSNSEVFDVLEIQFEYLSKLFNNTNQKIYLFVDKEYDKETSLKYETILYDNNTTYNKRLTHCISKIKGDYFIITQENDILFKLNKNTILKIIDTMKLNSIDSIELKQQPNCNNIIKVSDILSLSQPDVPYTFNVQPRIWNRNSAIKFFKLVPNKTYKTIENGNVQNIIKSSYKTYSLCSKYQVKSLRQFIQIPEYTFLHITHQGGFLKQNMNNLDKSILDEYNIIYNKYIKSSKRGEKEYVLV